MTPGQERQVLEGWRALPQIAQSLSAPSLTPEQEAWVKAWCAVAGAGIKSAEKDKCAAWADRMLEDFRQRWPE